MVTKELLSKQLNGMLNEGKYVICLPKFPGDIYDFNKFGFAYYQTMTLEEFDSFIYMTETTANLFHDAYSFNVIEFILQLLDEGSYDVLETMLSFDVDWATE